MSRIPNNIGYQPPLDNTPELIQKEVQFSYFSHCAWEPRITTNTQGNVGVLSTALGHQTQKEIYGPGPAAAVRP